MQSLSLAGTDARLRYHDIPGNGAPLIFVHGLGCASSCDYPRVAGDPALAGRRMVLADLLGSGFSDRPDDFDYAVDSHARTIAALAESLGPGPVDLYGHSMGGAVAIAAATALGAKVRRLVLSEPNLDPGGGAFSRGIAAMAEADYVAHGHRNLARSSAATGNDVWAASLLVSAPRAVYRGAASLVAGGRPSWRDQLLRLAMPRTVLFGEQSLPQADAGALPAHGIAVGLVPAAGHAMAWQNPGGLAAALHRALA